MSVFRLRSKGAIHNTWWFRATNCNRTVALLFDYKTLAQWCFASISHGHCRTHLEELFSWILFGSQSSWEFCMDFVLTATTSEVIWQQATHTASIIGPIMRRSLVLTSPADKVSVLPSPDSMITTHNAFPGLSVSGLTNRVAAVWDDAADGIGRCGSDRKYDGTIIQNRRRVTAKNWNMGHWESLSWRIARSVDMLRWKMTQITAVWPQVQITSSICTYNNTKCTTEFSHPLFNILNLSSCPLVLEMMPICMIDTACEIHVISIERLMRSHSAGSY